MTKISPRHLAWPGSSRPGCTLCGALGLGRAPLPADLQTLPAFGYTHVLVGCGASNQLVEQIRTHRLKPVMVVHESSASAESKIFLTSSLSGLPSAENFTSLLWIPQNTPDLAAHLRALPSAWASKLHVYWPHAEFLPALGWTWSEAIHHQVWMHEGFPHLRLENLPGLDVHNPEMPPDFALNPEPATVHDSRAEDFAPKVSIVIPAYDRLTQLRPVLRQLRACDGPCEILVVDDGSRDGTGKWFSDMREEWVHGTPVIYLGLERTQPHQPGQGGYRAGIARNVGVRFARGSIYLFLDSDILIPRSYIQDLIDWHQHYDVIQPRRQQLRAAAIQNPQLSHAQIRWDEDVEMTQEPWRSFQNSERPWSSQLHGWKFTSTFCLSLKAQHFKELGWFRRSFYHYGFEDTDLGYRAHRRGLRFLRADADVFHIKPTDMQSEYRNSSRDKALLLRRSSQMFYLNNVNRQTLDALGGFIL